VSSETQVPSRAVRRVPLEPPRDQTPWEEVANSLTHGVGVALSVVALVLLVTRASLHGNGWNVATLAVFGGSLVVLYGSSTLYHAFQGLRAKRLFWILDHSSIFLLIAATYTPVVLGPMRGPWGFTLFGLVWAMAFSGIVLKFFLVGGGERVWAMFYLAMGWLVLIALKPMLTMVPAGLVSWLVAGGAAYTVGVLFFLLERMPFNHAVWHLFVMAGSGCHFFGMLLYLTDGGGP